jgi:hypothetical protein
MTSTIAMIDDMSASEMSSLLSLQQRHMKSHDSFASSTLQHTLQHQQLKL